MSRKLIPGRMMRVIVLLGALALALISVANSLSSGNQATSTSLNTATAAVPIPASQGGGFYIADAGNNIVRKVDTAGNITTVAGTGTAGNDGDGGPATQAKLNFPTDAVPTSDGGILITSGGLGQGRIRKVSSTGIISTVAGADANCAGSDSAGNGCPATQAKLSIPTSALPLIGGGFLIAEWNNGVVRKVDTAGIINKVAGGPTNVGGTCPGHLNDIGDGCPATQAVVSGPTAAIPFDLDGAAVDTSAGGTGFLITEEQGCRVRHVDGSGVITTVAGLANASGNCRASGDPPQPDSGTATSLKLTQPKDARPTGELGIFLVADGFSCRTYRVNMGANTYTKVGQDAGCTSSGGSYGLTASVPLPTGDFLAALASTSQIAQAKTDGTSTVVAGTAQPGYNTAPPEITGTPAVGQTLSCSNGSWSHSPTTFTRQWNRDGAAISGATGATYAVVSDDVGRALTCTVTATGPGPKTSSATSAPVTATAGGTNPGSTSGGTTTSGGSGPAGGSTSAALPKAACTFTKRSGVIPLSTPPRRRGSRIVPQPKNTLALAVRCNQAARATIRGTLKQTIKVGRRTLTKSINLAARTLSLKANVAVATTLSISPAVVSAIKRGVKTSATIKLTAANANPATATIPKLSTKR